MGTRNTHTHSGFVASDNRKRERRRRVFGDENRKGSCHRARLSGSARRGIFVIAVALVTFAVGCNCTPDGGDPAATGFPCCAGLGIVGGVCRVCISAPVDPMARRCPLTACCDGLACNSSGNCTPCNAVGGACSATQPCCGGHGCSMGTCQTCFAEGGNCSTGADCCGGGGLECIGASGTTMGTCRRCDEAGAICGANCCVACIGFDITRPDVRFCLGGPGHCWASGREVTSDLQGAFCCSGQSNPRTHQCCGNASDPRPPCCSGFQDVGGVCAPCATGTGDCDGDPANGCETALDTVGNCGACGNVCPGGGAANTVPICIASPGTGAAATCGVRCSDGFASCGGRCVWLNDPMSCGGCGVECTPGQICDRFACVSPSCMYGASCTGSGQGTCCNSNLTCSSGQCQCLSSGATCPTSGIACCATLNCRPDASGNMSCQGCALVGESCLGRTCCTGGCTSMPMGGATCM